MNKWQKEVAQSLLDSEEDAIAELERSYKSALRDINDRIRIFESEIQQLDQAMSTATEQDADVLKSMQRSKVYQKQYQETLKRQVSGIVDNLHSREYATIQKYLDDSYTTGFVGAMYDMAGQGIPVITPINQAAAVKAILTDSKISKGLYSALGIDTARMKKRIAAEITRGISTGMMYNDIARNISNMTKAPLSRAKTIARTEGHRIQQASELDAMRAAKARGADVVKQWDATLDGATRKNHRKLDGQIREVNEPFTVGRYKPMHPGDFGDPAEDCNCRCRMNQRARWMLDEDELQTLKDRAAFFGLDKTDEFEDFKKKYLKVAEESEEQYGVNYGPKAMGVDWDYIGSAAFGRKFDGIAGSKKADKNVSDTAKEILKHCDDTTHEDLYLLTFDGVLLSKVTDSAVSLGVNYTDEFREALQKSIKEGTKTIAIHNHPEGTPPSPDDFRKAFENKYGVGIIIGHNGQVYVYKNSDVEITKEMADNMADDIAFFYRNGYDIDNASRMVYNGYGLEYTIMNGDD